MELRKTGEIVKGILEANKRARDDDFTLYGLVLNYYGLNYSTPFNAVAELVKAKQIPSMETVSRCRRRVQELYPELQSTTIIKELRDELQLEYVEFVQDRSV